MEATPDISQTILSARRTTLMRLWPGLMIHEMPNGLHVTLSSYRTPNILLSLDSLPDMLMDAYPDYKLTGAKLIVELNKNSDTGTNS